MPGCSRHLRTILRSANGSTLDGDETIFEVLWRDLALKPEPSARLPLSRYFGPPFGWMVARTGWDEDAVIAEMKVNEYNFANHQHLDADVAQQDRSRRCSLTLESNELVALCQF